MVTQQRKFGSDVSVRPTERTPSVQTRALIRRAVKRAGPSKKVWCSRLGSTKTRRFHLLTLELRFRKKLHETPLYVNQELFLLHFCSMAMGKGKFFRDETGLIISHCEWVKICSRRVVRVSFWLMNKDLCKKALFSGIELICEFLRTMLNHNQFLLSIVS